MANQIRQKLRRGNVKRRIQHRIAILRRCLIRLVNRFLACSVRKPSRYRLLPSLTADLSTTVHSATASNDTITHQHHQHYTRYDQSDPTIMKDDDPAPDSDLVHLKITLLGDSQIGKTSFLEKYVGDDQKQGGSNKKGLTQKDKTLVVSGARIAYCMWEVDGCSKYDQEHIVLGCKDSVAIMFMFDLTSRCTLNSVVNWYKEARKWNQTAILVMIGTKFDDFIQLPIDMQWTIASEARACAKALNATLFFSSSTYNINVSKVFKFITAKLFDLPWTVERNLNVGEPIIDF